MKWITFFTRSLVLTTILVVAFLLTDLKGQTLLTESFDGATFVPTGWTTLQTTAGNTWTRVTAGTSPTQAPHTGAGEAKFNSYSANNGVLSIVTPVLSFTAAGTKEVSFWMYRDDSYTTNADKIDVLVGTNNNAAGLAAATLLGTVYRTIDMTPMVASAGWHQYTYTIPAGFNTATNYLFFRGTSDYGANIFIDDILVRILTPCAGTPTGGTTAATLTTGCSGYTSLLSVTGGSTESGITYQWESSPDNSTWTNVVGATNATYTETVISNIYYRRKTTCTATNESSYSTSIQLSASSCYLISDPITATTCSGTFYDSGSNTADYSSSESYTKTICATAGLYPRATFTVFETESLTYDYMKIYDGNSTAAPLLGTWGGTTGPGTITGNNTCLTYQFISDGSTESAGWVATLSCVSPCSGTPIGGTAVINSTSGCGAGHTSVLSVSGATTDAELTYQWQSGPSATGPWTDVAGATNATYTATVNTDVFYRRITTCTNGGDFANSSAIQLTTSGIPTNDECANATLLTVNSTSTCTINTPGFVTCATASSEANSCSGTDDDDVWYKFVATSTYQTISLTNIAGSTTDMYFVVYSGACGSLTSMLCSDDESGSLNGLIVGSTYYVRVYTYTSSSGETSTFDICISTPSPTAFCNGASPFCSGTSYDFPAGVGSGIGEPGPNYGCLTSTPNPVWYYLKVATSGPIELHIFGSNSDDVDFACWGPFADPNAACTGQLTSSSTTSHHATGASTNYPSLNMIDCSYNTSFEEWCYIPNAIVGQYYLLLLTNFSNSVQNIVFSQTTGTGTTDCSIIAPPVTNNGPLCAGQTLQLTVTNPTAGATYDWTGPNGFTSTDMNPSITNVTTANAGIYSLIINVGGVNSDPVTTTVVINDLPTPSASSNSAICAGSALNLTSLPAAAVSYNWSGPNSFTSSLQNPSIPNATTLATGTYFVTVTATGGCTGTAQTDVIVNPAPSPSASNNGPLCRGTTLNLTALPVGATSYNWSGPNGFTSAIQNPSVTNIATTDAGTYTVTVTEANGCTATAQTTLIINGDLTVTPTSNSPICENETLNLSVPIAGETYDWSGPNGFTSAIQNPSIPNVATIATGTYSVTLTNASGCSGTSTIDVTVNALPTPSIAGNLTICAGKNTTLTASGGNSYQWSNSTFNPSITVSPATQTTYIVTVTTAAGCSATTSQTVLVDENPNITNIATTNELCNSVNGQAIANVSQGLPPYQYTWSNGGPNDPTNPALTAGQYTVTITDANGCTTTSAYTIQNIPGPQLTVRSVFPDHCEQGIGSATVEVNNSGTYTYSWLTTPPQSGQTASGLTSGTYLAVVSDGLCSDTLAVPVSNVPGPTAEFEPNPPTASASNSIIRFMNESDGGTNYQWAFGDGTTSTETSPLHVYIGSNTYTVTLLVTDDYNCIDSISKTVVIYDDMNVFIPNAFSPNSDNINEVFRPYGTGVNSAKPYEMKIYDRWGRLVFISNKFEKGWDGAIDGERVKMNTVFTYRIALYDYANKLHIYVGSFSLLGSKYDEK